MKITRLWLSRLMLLTLFLMGALEFSVYGVNYYISSKNGNDNNAGTSSGAAWKSLDKLKQVLSSLRAGDIVYLEKGSEWEGVSLRFSNLNGTAASPIIFATYGTGAKPRLKGSKVITSFTQSENIWRKTDNSLPEYITETRRVVPFVYINNKRYEVSRYPNSGYMTTYTTGVTDFLDSDGEYWPENYWKNALVSVRAVNWIWDSRRINYNGGGRLYFDDLGHNYEKESSPYLIRNHVNACDLPGEWAQQNDTLWVNYTGNLNQQRVEVPVVDTMIRVTNCNYLRFDGISFERANMYTMHLIASVVTVQNSNLSDAGAGLLLATAHCNLTASGNTLSYGLRGGIYLENSHGVVKNNALKRFAFDGGDNSERTFGASVANWYCDAVTTVTQNTFDSINIAYHGHISNAETYITKNVMNHYGMTVRDCAAIYFGTDYTDSKKHVSRNIILNSMSTFTHGIYIDYNSRNVIADSNSISGSNLAIYVHVSMFNSIKYNNIITPSLSMVDPWNSAVRFDEYLYNLGVTEVSPIIGNELLYNNIVVGTGSDEAAAMYFDVGSLSENTINYNNYFDPYSTDAYIIKNGDDYSSYRSFTLGDWSGNTGQDLNSTFNKTNWPYSSGLGVTKENFVLLVTNPTNQEIVYDLRPRAAEYIDVNGVHYNQTIKIPAYYSVILFYYKKVEITNLTPVISNQSFQVRQSTFSGDFIGKVFASDPDAGQVLAYSITSGNSSELFRIDASTGNLYFTSPLVDFTSTQNYTLSVQVTDNGNPVLSNSANITIQIIPTLETIYVDPTQGNSTAEDGSALHPFNSWLDVTWEEGKTYLQKAGTNAIANSLSITANSVTLGRYGEGTNPGMTFTTSDYGIRVFNLKDIKIENLSFEASAAIGCIYILGGENSNIDITGCSFKNAQHGIRTDGENVSVSYSSFFVRGSGIISFSKTSRLYYNLFKDNTIGVEYRLNNSDNYLYNNLYYENGIGVSMDSAGLVSYNNLFYLANQGQAINSQVLPENSNHNLFYPDFSGFITISGVAMVSLNEYRQLYRLESNSLSQDPLLLDPVNNDFSVQDESPAIDAGKNLGILVDFAGSAVPNGGSTDIGLYEKEIALPDPRLALYPNPSSGIVNLLILNGEFIGGTLTVIDLTGNVVKIIPLPAGNQHTIDVKNSFRNLDRGTYLLRVESADTLPFNQKLTLF